MLFHRIVLNFGLSPTDQALTELLQQSFPQASHPTRLQGFYSSRHSLLQNLREFFPDCSYQDLLLHSHHQLAAYPDLTLSLSHSPLAGASVLGGKGEYQGLGIDIEPLSRVVKESIIHRVTTPRDQNLSPVEIWCLKEAIYKCVSNSGCFAGILEFREMEIGDGQWYHSPSALQGEWKLFTELGHQIAIATLKNQNFS